MPKTHNQRNHMTVEEFLEQLKNTPRRWALRGERILFDADDICPISAVAGFLQDGAPREEGLEHKDAEFLGLSKTAARRIMSAADFDTNSGLRKQMLWACDLSTIGEDDLPLDCEDDGDLDLSEQTEERPSGMTDEEFYTETLDYVFSENEDDEDTE